MKKRSILWSWGLSYLLLLLIPLISIFANYSSNINTIKQEYIKVYELTNSNLRDNIDALILSQKKFYNYIVNNDTFERVKLTSMKDSNYYYNAYYLQSALHLYCQANDSLNAAIYLTSVDQVCANENSTNTQQYYKFLQNENSNLPTYNEWSTFMSTQYQNSVLIGNHISHTETPSLIYANTLVRSVFEPINIFIAISIDEIEVFTQCLPDNVYFVLQMSNQELYTFDNSGLVTPSVEIKITPTGNFSLDEQYLTVSSASFESEIICHLVIFNQAIANNLQYTQKTFILNLTITLLLGLVALLFVLQRNYHPVSQLLNKLGTRTPHTNEFKIIEAIYEQLQKNYLAAHATVQRQNQDLLNSSLLSLLKGRISVPELLEYKKDFNIKSDSPIALIGIMIPLADSQNIEYDELLFFITNNIFQELFKGDTFYCIEDGRFIYYLFDLKSRFPHSQNFGETAQWNNYALEKLDYLCSLLNRNSNTPIIAVVSEVAKSIDHCKFLYRRIMETFEFQSISGGNEAISTHTLSNTELLGNIRESIELPLNKAIKEGNLSSALEISSNLFSSQQVISFAAQKIYAFNIFNMIIDIFNNYTANSSQQVFALDYINSLMQATNADELKCCIDEILTFICEQTSQKCSSEGRNIVSKIHNYIEEHYSDQNLSVGSMADNLERNPKYITRIFKEDTGEGILDYINQYRISKAIEIMQTNTYTLEEISEMVGYSNVRAFRRAFVKITGEIPSKYKKY